MTALFIIGRIVASPATNVFQKRLTNQHIDPLFIVFATHVGLTLFAAPLLPILFPIALSHFSVSMWFVVLAMGACETLGNVFLVKSLQHLDISVFGPLNSFKPAMGMLLGMVVLSEIPSLTGFLGLLVIIFGSILLRAPGRIEWRRVHISPLLFRFLAMFFASSGAVLSKQVILASNSFTALFFWIILAVPFLGGVLLFPRRSAVNSNVQLLKSSLPTLSGVILLILLMQSFTLLTFKSMSVGYALALFQLSSVISVLFGSLFNESYIGRRLVAALVMLAGAVMILRT